MGLAFSRRGRGELHRTHGLRRFSPSHSTPYRRGSSLRRAIACGAPWERPSVPARFKPNHCGSRQALFNSAAWAGGRIWIVANLIVWGIGGQPVDLPAFPWLRGAAELFPVFIVMLILVAQKHEDELNAQRDTLTLELAILSEQKIAKVILLLEELRRDSPHIHDRVDSQADQMAQHSDARSLLAATRANPAL